MLISGEPIDELVLADGTAVRLGEPELAHLHELRAALAVLHETADLAAIGRGLTAVRSLLAALPAPAHDLPRRPQLVELRRLSMSIPEFGELLTVAAEEAGRAVAAGYARLWAAIGLSGTPPYWDSAEHEAARMVFACACDPASADDSDGLAAAWLQTSLRRIAATRVARLICADLAREERVWLLALGDRYGSLRHRCAPRTALRSRGLSHLLAGDADCRLAVTGRLERWVAAGGHPEELAGEIEAVVVHARTPSRLA